eukprot:COSAG01_NODE_24544_length_775_cov_1.066568_1_plen_67_part_00
MSWYAGRASSSICRVRAVRRKRAEMQERKRARQRVVASTVVRLKQEAEERSAEKQLRQGGRREEIR